jgi:hypothetical protein
MMKIVPGFGPFLRSTLLELILLFVAVPSNGSAHGEGQSEDPVKTNLEVFRIEFTSVATELLQRSGAGLERNLVLNVRSPDSCWLARNTIVEALKKMNYNVYLSSPGSEGRGVSIDIGIVEAKVRYGKTFRESFLGGGKTERTISTIVSASVRNLQNEILFAGDVSREYKDTVNVSDVSDLENPSISCTHGEPPDSDFFDELLEPIIIVGASAVVVYLFFTVRS